VVVKPGQVGRVWESLILRRMPKSGDVLGVVV
jgi:hypothetical protein